MPIDKTLIDRYLQGDSSPGEAQMVLAYLASPDGQRYLGQLLDGDFPLEARLLEADDAQRATQLLARIHALKNTEIITEKTIETPIIAIGRRGWLQTAAWRVAASVAFVALALGSWWLWQQPDAVASAVNIKTSFGQTRLLTLPDKSVVTLNGNSSVRYAEKWDTDQPREVWITGEGFFDVVHTANHQRFVVHLPSGIDVEVLGTRFNVYGRQANTKVILDTGKIRLNVNRKTGDPMVMQPGEMFEANAEAKTFFTHRVNAKALSSWHDGKLTFDGTRLSEVAQILQDTYGLTVRFSDAGLANQTISGTVPNQNSETILNGLATLFNLNIIHNNAQTITIEPNQP
jgi:transmembrane sensor